MVTVGLDLSLTKSGIVILGDGGKVIHAGVVKSKPLGDTYLLEVERIVKIVDDIFAQITKSCKKKPDLVCIENLAFMARNTTSLTQQAGLSFYVRIQLARFEIPFVLVAPTSLKKLLTGSGKGDKDMVMMSVFKHYGFEASGNDECDAFGLSVIGQALLGKPVKKLGVPQQEVIKLLSKQL